jgi:hypothetical protein
MTRPLRFRPDAPGLCGACDDWSPRVCTLAAGHEGAHADAYYSDETFRRVVPTPEDDAALLDRHGRDLSGCGDAPDCRAAREALTRELRRQLQDRTAQLDALQDRTALETFRRALAELRGRLRPGSECAPWVIAALDDLLQKGS